MVPQPQHQHQAGRSSHRERVLALIQKARSGAFKHVGDKLRDVQAAQEALQPPVTWVHGRAWAPHARTRRGPPPHGCWGPPLLLLLLLLLQGVLQREAALSAADV